MRKYLAGSSFLSKVLSLSLTTLIAHLITLGYYPVLTKTYLPQDFGNFQTFQAVSAYFIVVCSLRYDQAIITSHDRKERTQLFFSSIVIAFAFSLLLFCILYFLKEYIAEIKNFKIISDYWYLIPVNTFIGGCINACLSVMILEQKFNTIGGSKILQSSSTVAGQMAFNTIFRQIGLVLGDMIGKALSLLAFVKYFFKQGTNKGLISYRKCFDICKKYKEFAWLSTPGALLNLAGLNLPMLIIAGYYSQTNYGYIALVDRLFGLPSALIGQSVSQVFTAEFNVALNQSKAKARSLFLKQLKYLALLISPVLLFLPFAPSFFSMIFGEGWITSGYFFVLLAPLNIVGFIVIPVIPALTVLNKQRALFMWVLLRVVVTVTSVLLLSLSNVPIQWVLGVHSFLMAAMYVAYVFIAYKAINK